MKFKWKKKGLIFDPRNRFDWMKNFAQVPTILELNDRMRIYFTCRPNPEQGQYVSLISFIDVDKYNPKKILYIHDKPVLELGKTGSFDEFGTHPCCLLREKGCINFYYQGWTRMSSVPYATALGLAKSYDDGLTFTKFSEGPLFSRSFVDPFLENGFFTYKKDENYFLFYASCKKWILVSEKHEPIYKITSAVSSDGINWKCNGSELFAPKFENEASGRPCVIRINNVYHMWFCYRDVTSFRGRVNGAYRIGYAWSDDLINWNRQDADAGIEPSSEGWDSEMIAYPFVQKIENKIYMFYNGNEFGKYGFGFAELEN